MILRASIIGVLLISFLTADSQNIRAITIGENFPALPESAVVNHSDSVISLTAYNDKLVILDFWATWCTACIRTFPKMDSLQDAFSKDVKIVLINISETREKIFAFLAKYKERNADSLELPIIWGNLDFYTLLPHRSIPHYAWIYNGKLIATTGPDEITSSNISAVLNNSKLQLRMKKDIMDYDDNKALLENGNGGDSTAFDFKSFFSPELPGMNNGYFEKKTRLHRRRSYINFSIAELFGIIAKIPPYGIFLDLPEPGKHTGQNKKLFSYEITGPVETPDSIMTGFSLQDLSRYLNVSVTIRKKRIPVYRLVMTKKRKTIPSADNESSMSYNERNTELQFINAKISNLVSHLNFGSTEFPARLPIVDDTGYKGGITLDIPSVARTDIKQLRQILQKAGLKIKKGKRQMRICVIKAKTRS